MKHIIISPDSFKGSLTACEVATTMDAAIKKVMPNCHTTLIPMADGGEGTAEVLTNALHGKILTAEVQDPLQRTIIAQYGLLPNHTAIIELAAASGLTLLKPDERNPLLTSTYGTGELIAKALEQDCTHIIVSIGGSATNDGGMGMMQALGYHFFDIQGNLIPPCGKNLINIASIDSSHCHALLQKCHFTLLADVNNPLYGPNGAAHIFAPQKGATPEMVDLLDRGLQNWSHIIKRYTGQDIHHQSGAGAAGGVGAALLSFFHAESRSGIEYIMEATSFEKHLATADLILTGEGSIDAQSLQGKLLCGIIKMGLKYHINTVAFAGNVSIESTPEHQYIAITPPHMSLAEAMKPEVAIKNLYQAVIRYLETLNQI